MCINIKLIISINYIISKFTVMEKEELGANDRNKKVGEGKTSFKHGLADVWVIRTSELGQHEDYIHCRTHLGRHLEVGDDVLGYDLKSGLGMKIFTYFFNERKNIFLSFLC